MRKILKLLYLWKIINIILYNILNDNNDTCLVLHNGYDLTIHVITIF